MKDLRLNEINLLFESFLLKIMIRITYCVINSKISKYHIYAKVASISKIEFIKFYRAHLNFN